MKTILRKILFTSLFMFAPVALLSQGTSTLTGTVTDSDSISWGNATWTASLYNPVGGPMANVCGGTLPGQTKGTLSGGGVFSGTLIENSCISPSGTGWILTIQSNTSAPPVTLPVLSITTGTYNMGAYANQFIIAPRFVGSPGAIGYACGELLSPSTGQGYFNTLTDVQYIYYGSTCNNIANGVSPVGYVSCPGVVNDGVTNNATALQTCANTGGKYILPNNCQGSNSTIVVGSQISITLSGTSFIGSGFNVQAGTTCITTIAFSGATAANMGFNFNCASNGCANTQLSNMTIVANSIVANSIAIQYNGTGSLFNNWNFLTQLSMPTNWAQDIVASYTGNSRFSDITGIGSTNCSSGQYLVDFPGSGSNDNYLDRLSLGGATGCFGLRFQSGVNNHVTFTDSNNWPNSLLTIGFYNGTTWTNSGNAYATIGDTEASTCPLVTLGQSSQLALSWIGTQTTITCASGPLLVQMNGSGALTLYNPAPVVGSVAGPLVTTGASDVISVIGGAYHVSGTNLGYLTQDVNGQQYFGQTVWSEITGAAPTAALAARGRAFFQPISAGIDVLTFPYQCGAGPIYCNSGNIFQAITPLAQELSIDLTRTVLATNGVNVSSDYIEADGQAWSTSATASKGIGVRFQTTLNSTAQTPTALWTASCVQSGSLSGFCGVDLNAMTTFRLPYAAGYTGSVNGQLGFDSTNQLLHVQTALDRIVALDINLPTGTPTYTPGTNVTSVACTASYTCTNKRGKVTIVGGTAVTGTIATINFSASVTTAPGVCIVTQDGLNVFYGLSGGVPTATSFTIGSSVSVTGITITAAYLCLP